MSRAQGNKPKKTGTSSLPKESSTHKIYWDKKRQCGSSHEPHNVSVTYVQRGRKTDRGTSDLAIIHVPLKTLSDCGTSHPIQLLNDGDGFTVRFVNDSLSQCILPLNRVSQRNIQGYAQVSEGGIEAGMSTSRQLTKETHVPHIDVDFALPFDIKEIDDYRNPEISCISVEYETPLGKMIETKGAWTKIYEVAGTFNEIEEDYQVAAEDMRRFKENRRRNKKSNRSERAITPLGCMRGDDSDDDDSVASRNNARVRQHKKKSQLGK